MTDAAMRPPSIIGPMPLPGGPRKGRPAPLPEAQEIQRDGRHLATEMRPDELHPWAVRAARVFPDRQGAAHRTHRAAGADRPEPACQEPLARTAAVGRPAAGP